MKVLGRFLIAELMPPLLMELERGEWWTGPAFLGKKCVAVLEESKIVVVEPILGQMNLNLGPSRDKVETKSDFNSTQFKKNCSFQARGNQVQIRIQLIIHLQVEV